MKKAILGALFAGAMFASCSSDEPVINPDNGNNGDGNLSYLSVNIVTAPETSSRAAGGVTPGEEGYEDGTTTENAVSKVRFYFFDEEDKAANVKANSNVNYYDWTTPTGTGTNTTGPVERQLDAVLLISTKAGDKLPVKLVAVVNPDNSLGDAALDLATLRQKVADYSTLANAEASSFVMCNSVYATAAKEEMAATALTADKFKTSESDAKNDPVYIYVERNVAKVRMNSDLTVDANGLIKVTDKDGNDIKVGEQQVYVKLEGWNVTGDLDKAFISKHIVPTWTDVDCFGAAISGTTLPAWNHPAYFRSYWADECNVSSPANRYGDFAAAKKAGFTEETNYVYCNENAVRSGLKKATQVIIPATLCDASGSTLTICEFSGTRFVDNATQDALKDAYLNYLDNQQKYYKAVTAEGQTSFTKISRADITFKTATAAEKVNEGETGAYYVYACLTDEALAATWHTSNTEGNTAIVEATGINTALLALPHAKIWNTGKTYYYFDVQHFNKKSGVVRNHLYDITLAALYGLGTPVYDPKETIYPEKPNDEDTYIAAKINILSWRVVPSSVTLDWGN